MPQRLLALAVLLLGGLGEARAQCPTISLRTSEPEICAGASATVEVDLGGDFYPEYQDIDWYVGPTPDFRPGQAGVTELAVDPRIERTAPADCAVEPELIALRYDGCRNIPVARDPDEMLLYWSGSGFDVDDLSITIPTSGAGNVGSGTPCRFGVIPPPDRTYAVPCVIYADETDVIPPNAYVVILLQAIGIPPDDLERLCETGSPVYVLRVGPGCRAFPRLPNTPPVDPMGPRPMIDFGCGTPQTIFYTVNGTNPGWYTVDRTNGPTGCESLPTLLNRPSSNAAAFASTSFQYVPEDGACGRRYIRGFVVEPALDCPQPAQSDALAIEVVCPVATLPTDETFICEGEIVPPIRVEIAGAGGAALLSYRVNASPSVTPTTGASFDIELGRLPPGRYVIELTGLDRAEAPFCAGTVAGPNRYVVNVGSATAAAPELPAQVCASDQAYNLTAEANPPGITGGTWSSPDATVTLVGGEYFLSRATAGTVNLRYVYPLPPGATRACVPDATAALRIGEPTVTTAPDAFACELATVRLDDYSAGVSGGSWLLNDVPAAGPTLDLSTYPGPVPARLTYVVPPGPNDCGRRITTQLFPTEAPAAGLTTARVTGCVGRPVDISGLVTPAGLAGTWQRDGAGPDLGATFVPSVTDAGTDVALVFTPAPSTCRRPVTLSVAVPEPEPIRIPTRSVCLGEFPIADLNALAGLPAGAWFLDGVEISAFDFALGSASAGDRIRLNYRGASSAAPCGTTGDLVIAVVPNARIRLRDIGTVCPGASFALATLLDYPAVSRPDGIWEVPGGGTLPGDGAYVVPASQPPGDIGLRFVPTVPSCFTAAMATVVVGDPDRAPFPAASICADEAIDLIALAPADDGRWVLDGADVSAPEAFRAPAGDYDLRFVREATGGDCGADRPLRLTVEPSVEPVFATDTRTCPGRTLDLASLYRGPGALPAGMWTGTGSVDLDGARWTVGEEAAGTTVSFTFTPAAALRCGVPTEVRVRVGTSDAVTLAPFTACALDLGELDLGELRGALPEGGVWSFGGSPLTGDRFALPAGRDGGTFPLTYVVAGAGDECGTDATLELTVTPASPVALAQNRLACAGLAYDLTQLLTDPSATGTFSSSDLPVDGTSVTAPADYVSGSGEVTFAPSPGQCLTANSIAFEIAAPEEITGLPLLEVCEGQFPLDLDAILPADARGGTWTYEGRVITGGQYEPAPGEKTFGTYVFGYEIGGGSADCGRRATLEAIVREVAPVTLVTPGDSLCAGTVVDLSPYVDPGIVGAWTNDAGLPVRPDGTVSLPPDGGGGALVFRFEPTPASCLAPGEITVGVRAPRAPALSEGLACSLADSFDLGTLVVDPARGNGAWTGPAGAIAGQRIGLAGLTGVIDVEYLATGACTLPATTTLTVASSIPAELSTDRVTICTSDLPLDLRPFASRPVAEAGLWLGNPDLTGFTYAPTGVVGGDQVVRYGSADSLENCIASTALTIEVGEGAPVALVPQSICADVDVLLEGLFRDGPVPGTWTVVGGDGAPITGGVYRAPSDATTSVLLQFTPSGDNACASPNEVRLTIRSAVSPNVVRDRTICTTDPPLVLSGLSDPDFPDGVWRLGAGGPVVTVIDPADFPGQDVVNVEFDPRAAVCVEPVLVGVRLRTPMAPTLDTLRVCRGAPAISLNRNLPSGVPDGRWVSPGGEVTVFAGDSLSLIGLPLGLSRVRYEPTGCALAAEQPIVVSAGPEAVLQVDVPVCRFDEAFDLATLVGSPGVSGTWAADVDGVIFGGTVLNTTTLAAGPLDLTFEPVVGCASPASTTVIIADSNAYSLDGLTICKANTPYSLDFELPIAVRGGTWTGTPIVDNKIDAREVGPFDITYLPPRRACARPASAAGVIEEADVDLPLPEIQACPGLPVDLLEFEDDLPEGQRGGTWTLVATNETVVNGLLDPASLELGPNLISYRQRSRCGASGTTTVTLTETDPPVVDDAEVCELSEGIDLNTLIVGDFPDGEWSRDGVAIPPFFSGEFDRAVVLTYTYTDDAGCVSSAESVISRKPGTPVELLTGLKCVSSQLPLVELLPPGVAGGTWTDSEGNRVSRASAPLDNLNQRVPGVYTYTYTPAPNAECISANTTTVTFEAGGGVVDLADTTLCTTAGVFDLTALEIPGLDAITWRDVDGAVVTSFDPASGIGTTLSYTSPAGTCEFTGAKRFFVEDPEPVELLDAPPDICRDNTPFDLGQLFVGTVPEGRWSIGGEPISLFVPNQYPAGEVTLTFTRDNTCEDAASVTVDVVAPEIIELAPYSACVGELSYDLSLSLDSGDVAGTWSSEELPIAGTTADLSALGEGVYRVTFSPDDPCLRRNSTQITLLSSGSVVGIPQRTCDRRGNYELDALLETVVAGEWRRDGVAVPEGTIDLSTLAEGVYSFEFVPAATCITGVTVELTVETPSNLPIPPIEVCAGPDSLDLRAFENADASGGEWSLLSGDSGVSVVGAMAAVLDTGRYVLRYTPRADDCSAPVDVELLVRAGTAPALASPTSPCVSDAAIPLADFFVEGAVPGTWTGAGVREGVFDPSASGVGTHELVFRPDGGCVPPIEIAIEVLERGVVNLGEGRACVTDERFDLATLLDPDFPDGTWTDANGNPLTSPLSIAGSAAGDLRLTFTPTQTCVAAGTTVLTIVDGGDGVPLVAERDACRTGGRVALASFFADIGAEGTWEGEDVVIVGDSVDVLLMEPGAYVLTFAPSSCGAVTATTLIVLDASVAIADAVVWCGSGPVDLSTFEPQAGGTWRGNGVTGSSFDPSDYAGTGSDTLEYRYGADCPDLLRLPFSLGNVASFTGEEIERCGADVVALVDLEPADAPGGVWRDGGGTVFTQVDFGQIAPGETLTLTYGFDGGVCGEVSADWRFVRTGSGTLDFARVPEVCIATGVSDLAVLFPQAPASGSWSGPGVGEGGEYTPGRPDGLTLLRFAPPSGCYDSAAYVVAVRDIAELSGERPRVNCEGDTFTAEVALGFAPNNGPISSTLGTLTGTLLTIVGAVTDLPATVTVSDGAACTADLEFRVEADCTPLNSCAPESAGTYAPGVTLLCPARRSTAAGYVPPETTREGDGFLFALYTDTTAAPVLTQDVSAFDFGAFSEGDTVYVRAFLGVLLADGTLDPNCTVGTRAQTVTFGGEPTAVRDTVVCVRPPLTLYGREFTVQQPTLDVRLPSTTGGCDSVLTLTVNFEGGGTVTRGDILCDNEVFDEFERFGQVFTVDRPFGNFTVGTPECNVSYEIDLTFEPTSRRVFTPELCEGAPFFVAGREIFESQEIVLESRNGCDSIIEVNITNFAPPALTAAVETPECDPSSITVDFTLMGDRAVTASIQNGGDAPETYTFSTGRTRLSFPITGDPDLFVTQVTATTGGCREAEVAEFRINPVVSRIEASIVPMDNGFPFTACPRSPAQAISAQPLNGVGPYAYAWSRGDTGRTIVDVEEGDYTVAITDALGCEAEAPLTVVPADTVAFEVDVPDITCPDGRGTLTVEILEPEPGLWYAFDREPLQPLTVPVVDREDLPAGDYTFQLVRENGCEQDTEIRVVPPPVQPIFETDTLVVRLGDSLRFDLDYPPGTTVQWTPPGLFDCDTCLVAAARIPADLLVFVTVVEPNGCTTTDSVEVVVTPALGVYLPTAFSPNADGVNDVYFPLSGPEVERVLSFQIFSRWGEPVHQRFGYDPQDVTAAWDGRWRGKALDVGVYAVVVQVRLVNGEEITSSGEFTIMR